MADPEDISPALEALRALLALRGDARFTLMGRRGGVLVRGGIIPSALRAVNGTSALTLLRRSRSMRAVDPVVADALAQVKTRLVFFLPISMRV